MSQTESAIGDAVNGLASLSSSIVADAAAGRGVIAPGLQRFAGKGTAAGRAVTAACAEGSLVAVFSALDAARPGDFLCISAPGASAYLGDLLAADLVRRDLAGIIVDGLIRDRAAIANLPITVLARGVTPVARRGREPGLSMIPVEIGGVTVHPGDWIVADDDGVVVVAPDDVEAIVATAQEHARIEERIMAHIAAGATIMEAVGREVPQ